MKKDLNGKYVIRRIKSLGCVIRGETTTRDSGGCDRTVRAEDRARLQFWCGGCRARGYGPPYQSISAALLSRHRFSLSRDLRHARSCDRTVQVATAAGHPGEVVADAGRASRSVWRSPVDTPSRSML